MGCGGGCDPLVDDVDALGGLAFVDRRVPEVLAVMVEGRDDRARGKRGVALDQRPLLPLSGHRQRRHDRLDVRDALAMVRIGADPGPEDRLRIRQIVICSVGHRDPRSPDGSKGWQTSFVAGSQHTVFGPPPAAMRSLKSGRPTMRRFAFGWPATCCDAGSKTSYGDRWRCFRRPTYARVPGRYAIRSLVASRSQLATSRFQGTA